MARKQLFSSTPLPSPPNASAERRKRSAVAELGRHAIVGDDIDALFSEAVRISCEALEVDLADALALLPDGRFEILSEYGWSQPRSRYLDASSASHATYSVEVSEPIVVEELAREARFRASSELLDQGVISLLTAIIRDRGTTFGVLGVYSRKRRQFSDDDVYFLRSVANTVGLAVQRHRSTENLLRSEARYRELAESLPAAVLVTRPDGSIEYLNQALLDYVGVTESDALRGAWPGELLPLDDLEQVRAGSDEARARGEKYEGEYRLRHRDGTYRWNFGRMVPVRDDNGAVERWITVSIDIDDRKRAEHQLKTSEAAAQRLTAELRKSNAAKDEFLGLVSHELRTPVTTVYGNIKLLKAHLDRISKEQLSTALSDAESEAERLQRIIENLLVLAQFQANETIDIQPVDVRPVVQTLIDAFRRRFQGRTLHLDIADEVPRFVLAQPTYLDLVLTNMLGNAAKYSPRDGVIDVVITLRGDSVEFRVLDRGVGLRVEEIDLLFTPFYRSERTKSLSGGVGIGLAVCKRLLEAQHASIWARPRPGGGAEFGFSLPTAQESSQ